VHIVAVSDLHGHLPELPACDLLLIGGDLCPVWESHDASTQAGWIDTTFRTWLDAQPATAIVGIAGNHDFVAESNPAILRDLSWIYLEDESVTVRGLKIWGSPRSTFLPGWVFMETDDELARRWRTIPDDVNVLLIHGPARGVLDLTASGHHVGSISLRERIGELVGLQLLVCGHIHEGYGATALLRAAGQVKVLNASLVDFPGYRPVNLPLELTL
jgi:Icc-related predicted phosphoesterase